MSRVAADSMAAEQVTEPGSRAGAPSAPVRSADHTTASFASRVFAEPSGCLPARPSVSAPRTGTPVPSRPRYNVGAGGGPGRDPVPFVRRDLAAERLGAALHRLGVDVQARQLVQQGTGRGEAHLARRAADHARHRRRQTAVAEAEFPVARREAAAAAVAVVPRARELHLPERRDEGLRAPPGMARQTVAAVVAPVPPRARQATSRARPSGRRSAPPPAPSPSCPGRPRGKCAPAARTRPRPASRPPPAAPPRRPAPSLARISQCAVQRCAVSVGASPTRQESFQPVAVGTVVEVTKQPIISLLLRAQPEMLVAGTRSISASTRSAPWTMPWFTVGSSQK